MNMRSYEHPRKDIATYINHDTSRAVYAITTAPNNYSNALEIILLIWSLCKYSLVRSPCMIGGVLVRNLLRKSPCKLVLEGVVVMLPGVFVS